MNVDVKFMEKMEKDMKEDKKHIACTIIIDVFDDESLLTSGEIREILLDVIDSL